MKPNPLSPAIGMIATALGALAVVIGVAAARAMPVRIPAGQHELRMSISGSGSPTVILETFGPACLETWNRVQPRIARFARVVSYDHAGYWGSEPGPRPRDAARIVRELRIALRKANLPPPYILVGYSFGGPYIRVFAARHPDEVRGMVFVDPTQEEFMAWLNRRFPELNQVRKIDRQRQDEWGVQWDSLQLARHARLPAVPLTLITAAQPMEGPLGRRLLPVWREAHMNWLRPYPHARHIITTNSGHGIVFTEPDLIANAVRDVVELARPRP